jgi:hypothetical protein
MMASTTLMPGYIYEAPDIPVGCQNGTLARNTELRCESTQTYEAPDAGTPDPSLPGASR